MGPHARQAGEEVLELGEFDLELAFACARTLGEDVQNQARAVNDFRACEFFEIPGLDGREVVVKDDEVEVVLVAESSEFVSFAGANEVGGVDACTCADQLGNDLHARSGGERAQFFQAHVTRADHVVGGGEAY